MTDDAPADARLWWHYTLADRLLQIIAAGQLKRASLHVSQGERRAVWFSRRETWEPTATKMRVSASHEPRPATFAEMVEKGGALVRLAVPESVARHTWAEHRRLGGVDPRMADALETTARNQGADPAEWRVSYHDVPITSVVRIDASTDGVHWQAVGEPRDDGFAFDAEFVKLAGWRP